MLRRLALLTALTCAAACAQTAPAASPKENTAAWLRANFAKPPVAYSTMPFLVWNGEVSETEIDRHLKTFQAQGIHGFFIHPRYGLITDYLSDRWFDLIAYTVKRARELGMEAWLYDENSFPSGFAGGHVNEQMPASWNEGVSLKPVAQTRLAPEQGKRYAAALRRVGERWEQIAPRAEEWVGKDGEYLLYEIGYYGRTAWHAGWSYVDLIHPGVTEKFLDVTMRGYERSVGNAFGKTVPGIFTDEPNLGGIDKGTLRWTPDLFAEFERRCGYSLIPALPSLHTETGEWRRVRHDYFSLLNDLFIERWSKPYSEYAAKHNLLWTGHYWEHEWPSPYGVPDNMAMYAAHQLPAIDMLFNQFAEGANAQFGNIRSTRELASVAYQTGRRRTLSETYGAAGWELSFEAMKRLGDWEYAGGVNFMNQHLSYSTMVGGRKYDYPQSFGEHTPWWPHYRVLADYFARLSLALSAGETRNTTLVIEPTTSAWMYASHLGANARMQQLGEEFQQFLNAIEARQIEYDLGDERLLRDYGSVDVELERHRSAPTRLTAGQRAYTRVVLAPGTESLDASTVELLSKFLRAGGQVLSFVDAPALVGGATSKAVTELAAKYASQWKRLHQPAELAANGVASLKLAGAPGGKLFHLRRQLDSGELVFLVNSSLEAPARSEFSTEYKGAQRLDPYTGKIEPYTVAAATNGARVSFDLPPAGSLLLYLSKNLATPSTKSAPGPAPKSTQAVAATSPLDVHRLSPNLLRIDYLDYAYAGSNDVERDVYFFKAQESIFKHYGFDGNPWLSTVQFKTEILDKDHFAENTGFSADFHFRVGDGVPLASLKAVIERPWLWKVELNGVALPTPPDTSVWIDPDFGVYPLIGARAGDNTLRLTAQPFTVHHELEPVHILGDFSVEPEAKGFSLVAPKPLALGAWKAQGAPFFGDKVSYARHYKLRAGAPALVRLGEWNGTTVEVLVNGKSAGVMVSRPWELDIAPLVREGDNTIEVVVYGSLKNVFGPHHGKINRGLVTPWSHRYPPSATQPVGAAYDFDAYGLIGDFAVLAGK